MCQLVLSLQKLRFIDLALIILSKVYNIQSLGAYSLREFKNFSSMICKLTSAGTLTCLLVAPSRPMVLNFCEGAPIIMTLVYLIL